MSQAGRNPLLARGAVLIPDDGGQLEDLLGSATHIAVVAHPDDLELVAAPAVAAVLDHPDRSLLGVVCTDGAGSPSGALGGGSASGAALVARRSEEQARAAALGGYHVVMLGLASDAVRDAPGALVDQLVALLAGARPQVVATHDPFDRHATHAAVAAAVIAALRRSPADPAPLVLGCEGWRGLDWLAPEDRVAHDLAAAAPLLAELIGCFASQLEHKRYDVAAEGRWRAHATFDEPHAGDATTHLAWSLDLTDVCRPDGPTLDELLAALLIHAFRLDESVTLRDQPHQDDREV